MVVEGMEFGSGWLSIMKFGWRWRNISSVI